jgi:hypothetical protein
LYLLQQQQQLSLPLYQQSYPVDFRWLDRRIKAGLTAVQLLVFSFFTPTFYYDIIHEIREK